jgi:hypothetical protein
VSKVRFILVVLICEAPALLLWDGPLAQTLIVGVGASTLLITVRSLRPLETKFFTSLIRPVALAAAIPALWIVMQVIPIRALAHPIWKTAGTALGRSLTGAISIDPGLSLLALSQYLSITAVAFVSSAIAVDRNRAEWLLFALTGSCSLIALIALLDVSFSSGVAASQLMPAAAIDCAALGTIFASAAGIRAVDRYETRRSNGPALLPTSIASSAALSICSLALLLHGTQQVVIAGACGCATLVWIKIMRRFALLGLSFIGVSLAALIAALFLLTMQPIEQGKSLLLAFAPSSPAATATSERMLTDAPLAGTGAGTFVALQPIYHEIDESQANPVAPTTAATLAIELGKPMFWLIVVATLSFSLILFAASLRRGRDSFYPAMGGGCLITLLLLAFINNGLLAIATEVIVAASLGLAIAQSKSRTAKPEPS